MNLVGEHTDYNGGLVLPTLIPQRTVVTLRARSDRSVTLQSDAGGTRAVEVPLGTRMPRHDWSDHVIGVVSALIMRGHPIDHGFDARVRSDVPLGAGLASSAALGVATARALRDAFALDVDDREIALVAHQSEFFFVGAHVGFMDQLVCSLGREGSALLIDTADFSTRLFALDRLAMEIAVIDSGIRHEHATGEYNKRRRECVEAAHELGVTNLRELPPEADLGALPATLAKRARHVVSENARVSAACSAIDRGDVESLGAIVDASHASLRDDYEVSLPEIDRIVAFAQRDPDVLGARIVGGGFGGSVLLLTRPRAGRAAAERVAGATGTTVVLPAR